MSLLLEGQRAKPGNFHKASLFRKSGRIGQNISPFFRSLIIETEHRMNHCTSSGMGSNTVTLRDESGTLQSMFKCEHCTEHNAR